MNILHLDSSALGLASVSREVTEATAGHLQSLHPDAKIVYRDLAANPLAHLDGALLQALRPTEGSVPDVALQPELALTETLITEFLAADIVIIGAPMYNFSIPTQLKAWIDRIAQPGRTFQYTLQGPVGLAAGKKVIIVSSRGGMYAGSPMETALDHQEAYLRAVMGFFGVTDISVVRAEGIAYGNDARAQALYGAHQSIAEQLGSKVGSKGVTAPTVESAIAV